jgi:hypothetical protein
MKARKKGGRDNIVRMKMDIKRVNHEELKFIFIPLIIHNSHASMIHKCLLSTCNNWEFVQKHLGDDQRNIHSELDRNLLRLQSVVIILWQEFFLAWLYTFRIFECGRRTKGKRNQIRWETNLYRRQSIKS